MLTEQRTQIEVKEAVYLGIARIMEARGMPPASLRDEDGLTTTLGLKSLDLAELVFELQTTFGADPFEKLVPITSVRTVSDVVHAYLRLFDDGADVTAAAADELIEAQKASARRRARRGLP